MCNSDRGLEYSAVTALIDHENDDHGEKSIQKSTEKYREEREAWF